MFAARSRDERRARGASCALATPCVDTLNNLILRRFLSPRLVIACNYCKLYYNNYYNYNYNKSTFS